MNKEKAIEEVAYYVQEALIAMHKEENSTAKILPVIRSTSFPKQSEEGNPFIMRTIRGNPYLLCARF